MFSIEYLRQFRIAEYAIFDFAAAFLGILLLSPLLSYLCRYIRLDVPKRTWIFWTLPIGVLSHLLVGSITPMTRDLLDIHDHYILKILLLTLIFLGIKGIRIIRK